MHALTHGVDALLVGVLADDELALVQDGHDVVGLSDAGLVAAALVAEGAAGGGNAAHLTCSSKVASSKVVSPRCEAATLC